MTVYLLDTDVLVRAKKDHYRFGTFPCVWEWIKARHAAGDLFSVKAVEDEINLGNDDLTEWIATLPTVFLEPDAATVASAARLTAWASDPARLFTQAATNQFFAAADYWLVAHAAGHGYTVVTHELPEPLSKKRVKIPDACNGLGVAWMNPYEMLQREGANFMPVP